MLKMQSICPFYNQGHPSSSSQSVSLGSVRLFSAAFLFELGWRILGEGVGGFRKADFGVLLSLPSLSTESPKMPSKLKQLKITHFFTGPPQQIEDDENDEIDLGQIRMQIEQEVKERYNHWVNDCFAQWEAREMECYTKWIEEYRDVWNAREVEWRKDVFRYRAEWKAREKALKKALDELLNVECEDKVG